eukprot:jgi/Psemu1/8188/gm1.8188_g
MNTLVFLCCAVLLLSSLVVVEAFVLPRHSAQRTAHSSSAQPCSSCGSGSSSCLAAGNTADTDSQEDILKQMDAAKELLYRAAETKQEDVDAVVDALLDLEKLSRKANKADPSQSEQTLKALSEGGVDWRLIFTTGTVDTQRKLGGTKINYFPLKATQSFDSTQQDEWLIQNGIAVGDFELIKFQGDFDWTLSDKSGLTKLTFDFTSIQLLNGFFDIPLKKGEAASLGAKSGLGSANNVELEKRGKRAFFNWISADDKIATARGGGGGLALWKRM